MGVEVRSLKGAALEAHLDDVAALRIKVFRDWPYLYDGSPAYERRYLAPYIESWDAIVVGAFAGENLVGASTGTPLADHADDFAAALADTGYDISRTFYCAESVLLPAFRGQGIGHSFFDQREAHARNLGFEACCFCSVIRPLDHRARPACYRPLDGFWTARGYTALPGVTAQFSWKDVGDDAETVKVLQVWMRRL